MDSFTRFFIRFAGISAIVIVTMALLRQNLDTTVIALVATNALTAIAQLASNGEKHDDKPKKKRRKKPPNYRRM